MTQSMKVDVREHEDPTCGTLSFERFERTILFSQIDHGMKIKQACKGCPNHEKNFSCPPHSPYISDYVNGAKTATVLCVRLAMDYFDQAIPTDRYLACFFAAGRILNQELYAARKSGHTIAGSGACLACDPCEFENGAGQCPKPDEQIISLESMGVNVIGLLENCFKIDLDWSEGEQMSDTVCSVGAIFSGADK